MSDLAENKIRKNWLYSFFVAYGVGLISYLFAMFTYSNIRHVLSRNMFIFMIIFQLVFMLGWCFIFYSCAYKNPGRKFLAFNLIIAPISYAYVILLKLNVLPSVKVSSSNVIYERSVFILGLAIGIVFYIFSLKLFKLNKEIKKRLVKIPKE